MQMIVGKRWRRNPEDSVLGRVYWLDLGSKTARVIREGKISGLDRIGGGDK